MNAGRLNFNMLCDYATPDKSSALEFHMELPVPHQDLRQIGEWLDMRDWAEVERYLGDKYPRHRVLIGTWLRGSRLRSEDVSPRINLLG